jgi:pseudouridylate synthase
MKYMDQFIEISPEIKDALAAHKPVVALESTIIAHGFNYPENLECARLSEKNIRDSGAIPATIAIINGKIRVGLNDDEIIFLATNRGVPKCSRRDVAPVLATKSSGATTVTTTMMFAAMAGIKVFCTGGIGGVHRHGNETFDISADLQELANTNVAVVCAGAKSILDIPLTREYLETFGIPVLGYRTDDFPGFYTRTSGGSKVDYNLQTPAEIAKIIKIKEDLGLKGGLLITNPIPKENEMDYDYIAGKIDEALREAREKHVTGKATTPFLLDRLHSITGGKSVEANKALVFNNARLAAEIAKEYVKL